ncbi:hypothetical protein SUGI_1016720 [Cryptomeria japonica]|nr:hypothetical protein SUGI_1016720 [Cryptomeria japonica]
MEEEVVSIVFRVGANGVGLLDPGSENNNVEAGAKVELPFWLAQDLCLRRAVAINIPTFFNQRIKKEIKADPGCVNLRSRCPYFYELGCKIAPLVSDKSVGPFLLDTFRGRYQDILCKAHREAFSLTSKSQKLLTREESQLFEAARDSMKAFKKWRLQGPRLEKASVLGRKRKQNDSLHAT